MKTMKALVFKKPGKIQLESIPVPEIKSPDQVLIEVAACGICGSDVKILQGKHAYREDTVLGHEFCGKVVETGSGVTCVKAGDRVALDNNPRCGLCDFCRMGFSSQCTELKNRTLGVFQNGGYAEYCIAPESVCFRLPDSMDDILATQVETLATVLNGMNTVQMQPYDRVVVLGFGPIGYLFSELARNVAVKVIVTEIDAFRLNVAKKMGFDAYDAHKNNMEQVIAGLTGGKYADVVIDAVGNQLENALKYVTAGGKILAFGMDNSFKATVTPNDITRKAIKILGTYIGQNTMLPALRILEAGKINMKPFFTDTVPLESGVEAFSRLGLDLKNLKELPKKAMKLVLKP